MWEPKAKHQWRRGINQKHKQTDKAHGKSWKHPHTDGLPRYRRFQIWLHDEPRVKTAVNTGYGCAWERRKK